MELNNFVRITLPVYSKNYFYKGEEAKKKYRGKAHYIVRKEDKKIVFRTMEFDLEQEIIEASNYVDGSQSKSYISAENLKTLKAYRLKCFDWLTPIGKKPKILTKFKGDISYVNDLILESKATPKDVIGFISGSNAGGELKNPNSAEALIKFEDDCLVEYFGKESLSESTNIMWRLLGLLDNSDAVVRNMNFNDGLKWSDIYSIQEVDFCEVLNWNWKVVPWGKVAFEEDHVILTEAIASNNRKKFIDQYEHSNVLMFDEKFYKEDIFEKIKHAIETSNKKALKNILRSKWIRNVNDDIGENEYSKDFVKGMFRFKRCHIVEQHDAIDNLMNLSISWDDKLPYLEMLLNKNNYLLLDNTLHDYWDNSKKIIINHYGDIVNNGLPDEEYDQIAGETKNVYTIFNGVVNSDRAELLEYRSKQNT